MIRATPSYSMDSGVQFRFHQIPNTKPIYFIKSLMKRRKTKSKSQEATDSDQQNITLIYGPSRRKSCYCNECGNLGKKQLRYMDLKILKQYQKAVKKQPCSIDRRSTLNIQSINRSVFCRRNTQRKDDKNECIKTSPYDINEAKSPTWFVRQMAMRKSIINVQKLMDSSHSKNSYHQSSKKILQEDTNQAQSYQTINMPTSINSPTVRIRTIGGFEFDHHLSPPKKEVPKLSPYLSFRSINMNLLVPLRQKSNSSTAKKSKKTYFFHSKV